MSECMIFYGPTVPEINYSILFYSILFYSILFYSILFYSILFYSILFYSMVLSGHISGQAREETSHSGWQIVFDDEVTEV